MLKAKGEFMEQAILTIPEDVAADIRNGSNVPLARRLLELAAIKAYESDLITSRQAQEMLGFGSLEELFEFFKKNNVRNKSAREDLKRATAATPLGESFASVGSTPTSREINDKWLEANADKYRGQWVALKDGTLIAHSSDGKAFVKAVKDSGVVCPLLLLILLPQERPQIGSWDLILPNDHAEPSPIH
jgi:uncharacterized protein UPF0175/uncharacterized protein DUF5678